ncbi:hypothetical protein ACWCPM_11035 [Streptomyces sp. NPDC002309]
MPIDHAALRPLARLRHFLPLKVGSLPRPHNSAAVGKKSSRGSAALSDVAAGWHRASKFFVFASISTVVIAGCDFTDSTSGPPSSDSSATSSRNMVHSLETLLPRGKTSAQRGQGVSVTPGKSPFAELVFEHGGRSAGVKVVLNRYPMPIPSTLAECPDTAYHPYSRCSRATVPSGAILVQDRSPQDEKDPSGAELLTVRLTSKDGSQVFVSETGDPKRGRVELPLTGKQLVSIATAPIWQTALAEMPAPPSGSPAESITRLTGQQITRKIQQLLPAGLQSARAGGSEGFGHVVVDDGHGKGLVAVNVQRWKPSDPLMTKIFVKGKTLPDGTRIRVQKGPASQGGKGVIEWSVDTFRTDGLRVVISALNAPAYPLPPSRHDPALDIDQLKQIALNPAWQHATPN